MSPGVSHYDCGMAETTPAEGTTTGTTRVKRGMAEMLKGGVIMDVVTADQAKIAEDRLYLALSLVVLAMGAVTSYARAKADHLGFDAKVGIAERPDRLVGLLVPAFFADLLDLPILLHISLWLLAVASTVTVVQRMLMVRDQAKAEV